MAKRNNHYEAGFEAWLRWLRVPYVAVDESHRAAVPPRGSDERSLKSLDFIVSPPAWPGSWLVDVKGRQFPTAGCQYWRNWSTADELESLAGWEALLGPRFTGLLVFAYNVVGDRTTAGRRLFAYRNSLYLRRHPLDTTSFGRKPGSLGTVTVSTPCRAARPVREYLHVPLPTTLLRSLWPEEEAVGDACLRISLECRCWRCLR
jgi:hypothetical protein